MLPITIRKKNIGKDDLLIIQAVANKHWDKGRTHISRLLCKKWNWVQPNGRLKDMACREVLLTLSRKGVIALPPRKIFRNNSIRNRCITLIKIDKSPIHKNISDIQTLKLKMVRRTNLEPLYNSLVQQFHYLGYCQIVGNHLKYIACVDDGLAACLGWGSAAWSVKSRELFVGWNKSSKEPTHKL